MTENITYPHMRVIITEGGRVFISNSPTKPRNQCAWLGLPPIIPTDCGNFKQVYNYSNITLSGQKILYKTFPDFGDEIAPKYCFD